MENKLHSISVSIVYALPQTQWLKELSVARGTSVSELIENSSILSEVEDLKGMSVNELEVGIYAQKCDLDDLLQEGDRVEIYRPLTADPKEVRRQLALLGKTMGKK